jgi:hypothetical protein
LRLYIDCLPETRKVARLSTYVDELARALALKFGVADIRTSEVEPLKFGKWKAQLEAAARANPPKGDFAVVSHGLEMVEIVRAVLEPVADDIIRAVAR